jgi:hypothetical protein
MFRLQQLLLVTMRTFAACKTHERAMLQMKQESVIM